MAVARKICCQIDRITAHGEHVFSIELLPDSSLPRFQPGQFLHLALDEYEPSGFWPDSRVFSIANSPSDRERLLITYSVRGRFTARMEKELKVDEHVWVKLPYGEFIIDETKDAVLFAGGTGITAFTAFIDGLRPDYQHHVYLAYGARNHQLLIYKEMVEKKCMDILNFHALYFVEDVSRNADEMNGRLSVAAVRQYFQDGCDGNYYVSGPPVMLKSISQDLILDGINPENIKIDAWE